MESPRLEDYISISDQDLEEIISKEIGTDHFEDLLGVIDDDSSNSSTSLLEQFNASLFDDEVSNETEQGNKCKVCDGPAGRHIYYGGKACLSCKGFFRRAVQKDQHPSFTCKTDSMELCPIDSKARTSCRKCRFTRCLEAGMKPSWVLDERGRREKAAVRLAGRKNKDSVIQIMRTNEDLSYVFTEQDRGKFRELFRHFMQSSFSVFIDYFGSGEE